MTHINSRNEGETKRKREAEKECECDGGDREERKEGEGKTRQCGKNCSTVRGRTTGLTLELESPGVFLRPRSCAHFVSRSWGNCSARRVKYARVVCEF